jgi:hypothetical protein
MVLAPPRMPCNAEAKGFKRAARPLFAPEDEAAFESSTHTAMEVPVDLVTAIRALLAKRRAS